MNGCNERNGTDDALANEFPAVVRRKGSDERFNMALHSRPKTELFLSGLGERKV